MLLCQDMKSENQKLFYSLADEINWFFFDYFILGYIEDIKSGFSLRFPEHVQRSVYVEV